MNGRIVAVERIGPGSVEEDEYEVRCRAVGLVMQGASRKKLVECRFRIAVRETVLMIQRPEVGLPCDLKRENSVSWRGFSRPVAEWYDVPAQAKPWEFGVSDDLKGRCVAVQQTADGYRSICRASARGRGVIEAECVTMFQPPSGCKVLLRPGPPPANVDVEFVYADGPWLRPHVAAVAVALGDYGMQATMVDDCPLPPGVREHAEQQGAHFERVDHPEKGRVWKLHRTVARGTVTQVKFPQEPWASVFESVGLTAPLGDQLDADDFVPEPEDALQVGVDYASENPPMTIMQAGRIVGHVINGEIEWL